MPKFAINEVAMIVKPLDEFARFKYAHCEIIHIFEDGVYGVRVFGFPDPISGKPWGLAEHALRKLGDCDKLSYWDKVEQITGWNPVKELN